MCKPFRIPAIAPFLAATQKYTELAIVRSCPEQPV